MKSKKHSKTISPAMRHTSAVVQAALFAALLAALSGATIARNELWQSKLTIWQDAAGKSPNKARVHHNYGRELEKRGFAREAFDQYLLATYVDPGFPRAHESLGISYVTQGKYNLAKHELETALRLEPGLVEARTFLAYVLQNGELAPKQIAGHK